jgi:hypothetical protein
MYLANFSPHFSTPVQRNRPPHTEERSPASRLGPARTSKRRGRAPGRAKLGDAKAAAPSEAIPHSACTTPVSSTPRNRRQFMTILTGSFRLLRISPAAILLP